ncbi:MAG: ATP-binding cassette domain-containing protein, partial [Xanthobacteraceae bacterium]
MPELDFVNVRKSYQSPTGENLLALADFSLKVDGGRFVSVVGPSGCGKTTLLRMAAGLVPWDGGEIRLDGDELTGP